MSSGENSTSEVGGYQGGLPGEGADKARGNPRGQILERQTLSLRKALAIFLEVDSADI